MFMKKALLMIALMLGSVTAFAQKIDKNETVSFVSAVLSDKVSVDSLLREALSSVRAASPATEIDVNAVVRQLFHIFE